MWICVIYRLIYRNIVQVEPFNSFKRNLIVKRLKSKENKNIESFL